MDSMEKKQKTVMINTRISPELREMFAKVCDEHQQSQAKVLRWLIENYVKENKKSE